MPTGMQWRGADQLLGQLRGVAEELKRASEVDAAAAAQAVAAEARAVYQAHKVSGALARSVRITKVEQKTGRKVKARTSYSWFFEKGTRRSQGFPAFYPAAERAGRVFAAACEARVRALDRKIL